MMRTKITATRILSIGLLAFLILIPVVTASDDEVSRDQLLVIGKVTAKPKKQFRKLKPIADYMAVKMADLGIK